jgi:hypothetical protein
MSGSRGPLPAYRSPADLFAPVHMVSKWVQQREGRIGAERRQFLQEASTFGTWSPAYPRIPFHLLYASASAVTILIAQPSHYVLLFNT